jgi:hypothetical protein
MRTKLVLVALLVSFAALAVFAGAASPARATVPVVKTAAMLPGAAYPWVQPVWRTVHGVVIVTLPRVIVTANTQPPAWVFSH